MDFLPKSIKWIPVSEISSHSYQEVLIALHKHSARDWFIVHGWVEPNHQYTDFKIMAKTTGLSSLYPEVEIPKSEILAIGVFQSYGHLLVKTSP